jgi:hypothetical protein
MKSQSIRVAVLSMFLLASAVVFVSAAEKPGQPKLTKKEVKALIVSAQTPEDHLKLAAYFQDEARQEESKAKYHDEMAELYRQHPLPYESKQPSSLRMQNHCNYFADEAREAAGNANAMADAHEKVAEQLRIKQ